MDCLKEMQQIFNAKYKSCYSDGSGEWKNNLRQDAGIIEIPIRSGQYGEYINARQQINYCPFCGTKINGYVEV